MASSLPEHVAWKRLRTIGQGGQAHVHEVAPKDGPVEGSRFVLKQLSRQGNTKAVARFVREIEVIKRVSHPGVVEILDHSSLDDEFQYYVMPFVDGCDTLDKLITSDTSPFKGDARKTLQFVLDCCIALEAVHKENVVHRDLNPKNILVRPDLSPILIDFGCSYIDDGAQLTLVDEAVGARNYTAPECEAGEEEKPTTAADVYSLGKLMWALATGNRAFAREKPAFTALRLSKVLPDRPQTWLLTSLLKKMIRVSPSNRFLDASHLRRECEQLVAQIDTLVPIELVREQCPQCRGRECLSRSRGRIESPLKVHFDLLIRNSSNHPDLEGAVCLRCGYVFLQNVKAIQDYETELARIE